METIFVESSPTSVMSLRNIILESNQNYNHLDWAGIAATRVFNIFENSLQKQRMKEQFSEAGARAAKRTELPRKVLPRRVMVKEHRNEDWYEAELIANLTKFGIHENKLPFIIKHPEEVGEYNIVNFMMEIEDYEEMVAANYKKEEAPMGFGGFAMREHDYPEYGSAFGIEDLDNHYADYQEYLKEFKNKE